MILAFWIHVSDEFNTLYTKCRVRFSLRVSEKAMSRSHQA